MSLNNDFVTRLTNECITTLINDFVMHSMNDLVGALLWSESSIGRVRHHQGVCQCVL